MSWTTAAVVLEATDLPDSVGSRRIRAEVAEDAHVALYIDRITVLVGFDEPVLELADTLLAAVTEWHAEIHRRGHGDPIKESL